MSQTPNSGNLLKSKFSFHKNVKIGGHSLLTKQLNRN